MKVGNRANNLFLILLIVAGVTPKPAYGDSRIKFERSIRGPIGSIDSLGGLWINGQPSTGRGLIWGGEMIQSAGDSNAIIALDGIGDIRLSGGSLVRIAASRSKNEDSRVERNCLVATLSSGEIYVSLDESASAYIQAAGSLFSASPGARFNAGIRGGRALVNADSGNLVAEEQVTQRRYVVRPVGLGSSISVRARSTRQIQVQVTDENDKPVPDLPILFALGGRGVGQLASGSGAGSSATVTTDSQGFARVEFTAGDNPGSDSISATVEGTRYSWVGQLSVVRAGTGFWTVRNSLLIAAAAAAAVAVPIIVTRDNREPIRAAPPPRVQP